MKIHYIRCSKKILHRFPYQPHLNHGKKWNNTLTHPDHMMIVHILQKSKKTISCTLSAIQIHVLQWCTRHRPVAQSAHLVPFYPSTGCNQTLQKDVHQKAELRALRAASRLISAAFPLPRKYMYTCCKLRENLMVRCEEHKELNKWKNNAQWDPWVLWWRIAFFFSNCMMEDLLNKEQIQPTWMTPILISDSRQNKPNPTK